MQFTSALNKPGTAWTKQQKCLILRRVISESSERILIVSKPIFAEKDKSELSPKEGNYLSKVDLISYFLEHPLSLFILLPVSSFEVNRLSYSHCIALINMFFLVR